MVVMDGVGGAGVRSDATRAELLVVVLVVVLVGEVDGRDISDLA